MERLFIMTDSGNSAIGGIKASFESIKTDNAIKSILQKMVDDHFCTSEDDGDDNIIIHNSYLKHQEVIELTLNCGYTVYLQPFEMYN